MGQNLTEIVLQADAAKAEPGLKGNLIVIISGERTPQATRAGPLANRQRIPGHSTSRTLRNRRALNLVR